MIVFARSSWLQKVRPLLAPSLLSRKHNLSFFLFEIKEINLSVGAEYWYDNLFAARVGYFYEDPDKGNRQYFSMGLGIRYQKFGIDAAYLIPNDQNNPLAQTIRFSLHFNLEPDTESALPAQ